MTFRNWLKASRDLDWIFNEGVCSLALARQTCNGTSDTERKLRSIPRAFDIAPFRRLHPSFCFFNCHPKPTSLCSLRGSRTWNFSPVNRWTCSMKKNIRSGYFKYLLPCIFTIPCEHPSVSALKDGIVSLLVRSFSFNKIHRTNFLFQCRKIDICKKI